MRCSVCKPQALHIGGARMLCGGWRMLHILRECDLVALAEVVHAVYLRCCCAHGPEEGRRWLLLPQGARERRQRPVLPAGRAHPGLLAVWSGHLLSAGTPLWAARTPPLETAAGQLHPQVQGQLGGPAHPAASVRGGERSRDQSGHAEAPLGLFWSFLLCWYSGLHYWWAFFLLCSLSKMSTQTFLDHSYDLFFNFVSLL